MSTAEECWLAEDDASGKLSRGLLFRYVSLETFKERALKDGKVQLLPFLPEAAWSFGAKDVVPYVLHPWSWPPWTHLVLVADASRLEPWMRALYLMDDGTAERADGWTPRAPRPASELPIEVPAQNAALSSLLVPCLKPGEVGLPRNMAVMRNSFDGQALLSGAPWSDLVCESARSFPGPDGPVTVVEVSPKSRAIQPKWQKKARSTTELLKRLRSRNKSRVQEGRLRSMGAFRPQDWRKWLRELSRLRRGILRRRKKYPQEESWRLVNPDCAPFNLFTEAWYSEVTVYVPPYYTEEHLRFVEDYSDALLGVAFIDVTAPSRLDTGEACGQSSGCPTTGASVCSSQRTYHTVRDRSARFKEALGYSLEPTAQELSVSEAAANLFAQLWKKQTGKSLKLWKHRLPPGMFIDEGYELEAKKGELRLSEFLIEVDPVPNSIEELLAKVQEKTPAASLSSSFTAFLRRARRFLRLS
ncbi:hypothetical protein EBZ37_09305 [bacterium]|nr:hypothetical protein [bacterium]